MFSFFKKLRSSEAKQETEKVQDTQTDQEQQSNTVEEEEQQTSTLALHFPNSSDNGFSQEDRYVLQFFVSELPAIRVGELAIDGYKLSQGPSGLLVQAVLRNNMDSDIQLQQLPLVLQDANENTLARSLFDMSKADIIPAHSAVPVSFMFPYTDFLLPQADLSSWKVGFHMADGLMRTVVSELDFESAEEFSMHDHLEQRDQQVIADIQKAIQQTENQVNFIGTTIDYNDEGELVVELFLRNGREEEVTLDNNITFSVQDAAGDIVASKSVDMSQIKLSPKSVTRWTLVYDKASQKKENPDLSEWTVETK
jgi:SLAP domain-containing protein